MLDGYDVDGEAAVQRLLSSLSSVALAIDEVRASEFGLPALGSTLPALGDTLPPLGNALQPSGSGYSETHFQYCIRKYASNTEGSLPGRGFWVRSGCSVGVYGRFGRC